MAGRSARGDGRVDLAVLAVALLLSVIALAMPDARADRIASALRRTVFAPLATLQARAEHARRGFAAVDLEIARATRSRCAPSMRIASGKRTSGCAC